MPPRGGAIAAGDPRAIGTGGLRDAGAVAAGNSPSVGSGSGAAAPEPFWWLSSKYPYASSSTAAIG